MSSDLEYINGRNADIGVRFEESDYKNGLYASDKRMSEENNTENESEFEFMMSYNKIGLDHDSENTD
jgi:hypothetical protein